MNTTVKFLSVEYGNYLDNYYTKDYEGLIETLQDEVVFTRKVNLGIADGVTISNTFKGDFTNINCAIVEHDLYGTHIYRIIKRNFVRRNMWHITMLKDVVSARYEDILKSRVLVSRLGLDTTVFSPLLFTEESMRLSQVKSNQIDLGELKGAKSYGYLAIWARNTITNEEENISWNSSYYIKHAYQVDIETLNGWEHYGKNHVSNKDIKFRVAIRLLNSTFNYFLVEVNGSQLSKWTIVSGKLTNSIGNIAPIGIMEDTADNKINFLGAIDIELKKIKEEKLYGNNYPDNYDNFYGEIGKTIRVTPEETKRLYYEVDYNDTIEWVDVGDIILSSLRVKEMLQDATITIYEGDYIYLNTTATIASYKYNMLNSLVDKQYKLSVYNKTIDQPFEMFYIPVIEDARIIYRGEKEYFFNSTMTESLLYDLIRDYSGDNGKLLDVQLISYSPTDYIKDNWDHINKVLHVDSEPVDVIVVDDYMVPIYGVPYSEFQRYIDVDIDVEDYKMSEQEKYVLTTPSGAGQYEFSLGKNRGLNGILMKANLRPFASYFQLQPVYKAMYGGNYKDTRGLIWQEDSSLTQVSSAWETYKRQNVNYLNSFNEGQEHERNELAIHQATNWGNYGFDAGKRMLESVALAAQVAAEAVAADVWFGVKGAISGGAAAATIVGTQAAMEGIEAWQLAYNHRKQSELLSAGLNHARKQFNYDIGNIKALPENLNKVSGLFHTNNKVPYIQIFKPTEQEALYLMNYLSNNGVNLGQEVNLGEVEFSYLQGTILQFKGVITEMEYEELHGKLSTGVREYKEG